MKWLGCVTALVCAAPALAANEGFKRLKAGEIKRAFVGKTFSDDVHFTHRYKADGTIAAMSMGAAKTNRWTIARDMLCVTEKNGESCYEVLVKGREVRLKLEGNEITIDGMLK